MKRNKYRILLLILLILIAIIVGIKIKNRNSIKQNNQVSNAKDSGSIYIKDTIPVWKTYENKNFGITFKYPITWTKNGEESNAINRNGEIMSISVSFIDTITNSNFYLAYHFAPNGAEVYKLAEEDYNSSKNSNERITKLIIISGNKAFEAFTTMSKDIKGNIYDPALTLIHIVFLDKQKTGGFNLNFRTPEPGSEKEIAKFNQLLSTFKFIN